MAYEFLFNRISNQVVEAILQLAITTGGLRELFDSERSTKAGIRSHRSVLCPKVLLSVLLLN
jgi:hypothetical protein